MPHQPASRLSVLGLRDGQSAFDGLRSLGWNVAKRPGDILRSIHYH
jgi:hypothetical protein